MSKSFLVALCLFLVSAPASAGEPPPPIELFPGSASVSALAASEDVGSDGELFSDDDVVTAFAATAEAQSGGYRSRETLDVQIERGESRVTVAAAGSCESVGEPAPFERAEGVTSFSIRIDVGTPTRISLRGSLSADGPEGGSQGSTFVTLSVPGEPGFFAEIADGQLPVEHEVVGSGVVRIGTTCSSTTGTGAGSDLPSVSSSFEITLTLGNEESDVFAWVGGRTGDFDVPENWDPQGVPTFVPGERSDTALFDARRAEVNFAPSAAAASRRVGRGPLRREIGRLIVDRGDLTTLATTLTLRDASLSDPSLIVRGGGSLLLGPGADVIAQKVSIAPDGEIELLDVLSFSCPILESGGLVALRGGLVDCPDVFAEAGAFDLEGVTSHLVSDFFVAGELRIADGALLESRHGSLAGSIRPHPFSTIESASGQTQAAWFADTLVIEDGADLTVEEGGRLAAGDLSLKSGGSLLVHGGALEVSRSAFIGSATDGEGFLDALGDVSIGGGLEVVDGVVNLFASGSGAPATCGSVRVGAGRLKLRNGTRLQTAQSAELIPPLAGASVVDVGRPFDDPAPTAWTVLGSLGVGAAGDGVAVLRLSDGLVEAGSATVGFFGEVVGRGTLFLRGTPPFTGDGTVHNRGTIGSGILIDGTLDNESGGTVERVESGAGGFPQLNPLRAALPRLVRARAAGDPPPAETPLRVTGDASLDGTLVLQFRNGFAPGQGQPFEVLDVGGTVSGDFAQIVVQGLAPGAIFEGALQDGIYTVAATTPTEGLPPLTLKAKTKLKETKKKGTKLKIGRTGDRSQPLVVSYAVGGTAENGFDYAPLAGTLEIPAGKKSATITLRPVRDGLSEPTETIEIELLSGDGYSLPLVSSATLELLSKD